VKSADCAEHRTLLQYEIEDLPKGGKSPRSKIGATSHRRAQLAGPYLVHRRTCSCQAKAPLRVLLGVSESLAFQTDCCRHRNLLTSSPRHLHPPGVHRAYSVRKTFAWIVVEEDDSQFGRFLPMRLSDLRGWHPNYVLPVSVFLLKTKWSSLRGLSVFRCQGSGPFPMATFIVTGSFSRAVPLLIVC